jgi:hypothetical protein
LSSLSLLVAKEKAVADDCYLLYFDATIDHQTRSFTVAEKVYWVYAFHYSSEDMDAREAYTQRHEYVNGNDRLLLRRYEQKAVLCVQVSKVTFLFCFYI